MFVSAVRNRQRIFDLHGAPTDFVTGGFEVDRHAGLHRNVGGVRQERIVDFFCWPNQEREFPRFKTDGVAEEKFE